MSDSRLDNPGEGRRCLLRQLTALLRNAEPGSQRPACRHPGGIQSSQHAKRYHRLKCLADRYYGGMTSPSPSLFWQALAFDALNVHQLYAPLKLRSEAFVVEQTRAYLDPDGEDVHPETLHLLGHAGDALAAYLRILPAGSRYRYPSLDRAVVAPDWRGTGTGHALLREGVRALLAHWPGSQIRLNAQAHLRSYYAAHGFVPASPIYDQDGIPHVDMLRRADAAPEELP